MTSDTSDCLVCHLSPTTRRPRLQQVSPLFVTCHFRRELLPSKAMIEDNAPSSEELEYLRAAIHDLNNRVGVILTSSELLKLDAAEGQLKARYEVIEQKALEAREILRGMSHRYFD